jgi:hypothetical protein
VFFGRNGTPLNLLDFRSAVVYAEYLTATVQQYRSHGYSYYRLVTSRRGPDGKPRLVVLRHLGGGV